jgi:hypothetical protein
MKSYDGRFINIACYTYRKSVAKCLHLMGMRLALSTYGCKNCIQNGHTEQSWAFGLTSFQRYCIFFLYKHILIDYFFAFAQEHKGSSMGLTQHLHDFCYPLYTILTNRYNTQQKRNRRNSAEIDGFQTDL